MSNDLQDNKVYRSKAKSDSDCIYYEDFLCYCSQLCINGVSFHKNKYSKKSKISDSATSEKYNSIQIKVETYQELSKMGYLTDSFDSVISSLLKKSQLLQSDSTVANSHQIATAALAKEPVRELHTHG